LKRKGPLPFPPASSWEITDPGFQPDTPGRTVPVKETADRKVFMADGFYIKAFRAGRLRQIFADQAKREYEIARRLDRHGLTAPPAAYCQHGEWSYFAARAVNGTDLETFLDTGWRQLGRKEKNRLIEKFAIFIHKIAESGVFQPDFHLNNVLFDNDKRRFVLIDLHRASLLREPVAGEKFSRQLSFILPPLMDNISENDLIKGVLKLTEHRGVMRSSHERFKVVESAFSNMKAYWKKRGWRKTRHRFTRTSRSRGVVFARNGVNAEKLWGTVDGFASEPAIFIKNHACRILKDSRHTFCVDTEINGIRYFIKGYRSSGHFKSISYLMRQSRVEHAWNMSWQLHMRRIPVLLPLYAFYSGNPWDALYGAVVYPWDDNIAGSRDMAGSFMASPDKRPFFIKKLALFLWNMHERGICHGDCKITNFSITPDCPAGLSIFDLDSAKVTERTGETERLRDIAAMGLSLQKLSGMKDINQALLKQYASFHIPWRQNYAALLVSLNKMTEKKRARQAAKRSA
jgi:tRNA A-37 threonylcarbamoyl transferase component Bud32